MIRKDALPDTWNDSWHSLQEPQHLTVRQGTSMKLVLCNPADAPMFMLKVCDDYTVMPDIENMDITVEEGAHLALYRLQGMNCGLDVPSGSVKPHLTELHIAMQRNASANIFTITLGGSHVRNNIMVRMQGEGCTLEGDGLYLIDREQECDNYIFVEHAKPHCQSHELYKGIIDDAAKARFNGHVLVQDGAMKTEAYQTNRNILLTDKAHVDTRPFLEIYNDDVKCSHGSTIGQLDEQALYYLMTRGIPHRTAVTMLSYAFCDEVISRIALPQLRDAVSDMVKKRLHGELTPCTDCALQCSSPCNGPDANFVIDTSRI